MPSSDPRIAPNMTRYANALVKIRAIVTTGVRRGAWSVAIGITSGVEYAIHHDRTRHRSRKDDRRPRI